MLRSTDRGGLFVRTRLPCPGPYRRTVLELAETRYELTLTPRKRDRRCESVTRNPAVPAACALQLLTESVWSYVKTPSAVPVKRARGFRARSRECVSG